MNDSLRRRPAIVLTSMLLAAAPLTIADPVPHPATAATVHRVLFDDSKAETAGNADWIISTSMPDPLAQNRNPSSETSWTGAISAWGVALQRTGRYSLTTLPPAAALGNPGFETGTAAPWSASGGVVTNASAEPAHGSTWKAWLDGYGTAHTDTLSQTVTVPATCASAVLTFWLHMDTAETTTSTAYDTLTVTANGTKVAGYSNLDASSGYTKQTVDLSGYLGQRVTLAFTGVEGSKLETSFVVDDAAVAVA